jgi:hypothetical protein
LIQFDCLSITVNSAANFTRNNLFFTKQAVVSCRVLLSGMSGTDWISITVQQNASLYSFYSLKTAVHVSGDIFTHHQEHKYTVITASGTDRTVMDKTVVLTQCLWYKMLKLVCYSSDSQNVYNNNNNNKGKLKFLYRKQCVSTAFLSITVWSMPDAVITVYSSSWCWVKISPETCRAVCGE